MATIDAVHVTISVRSKPLLIVAAVAYALDRDRGGVWHRVGNRLVDACVRVTT